MELVISSAFFNAPAIVEVGNEAVGAFVRWLSYAALHFPETALLPAEVLGVGMERGRRRDRIIAQLDVAGLAKPGAEGLQLLGRGDLWQIRGPRSVDAKTQRAVIERDGGRCVYCGTADGLTIDHIVPVSRGGRNDLTNLAAACGACNGSKGNRAPKEWAAGICAPKGVR